MPRAHRPLICSASLVPALSSLGQALLSRNPDQPSHTIGTDKRPILACPWVLPPSRRGGLLLWRAPKARAWTEADHDLGAAVAMLLRNVIGEGMGQIGIDRLTGLPNRRWFLEESDRHIDRLDVDVSVGTLVLVDIDDLRSVNFVLGREQGDNVLVRMASRLRAMVRPSDIVARVGADEFALWHDGMDHLTAAERAESLCRGALVPGLAQRPYGDILRRHRQPADRQFRGRPNLAATCPHGRQRGKILWRRQVAGIPLRTGVWIPIRAAIGNKRDCLLQSFERRRADRISDRR